MYLLNSEGERFMKRYAPNAMELASRDVVSRSEQTEIDEGRGINGSVLLDLTPPRRREDHRAAAGLARARDDVYAGVDPIYEPIPVRPGAHYHMGGVETDSDGLTELTGLYAAGEVACVSVHGANRLGGNSLMETITFGRAPARAAAEWALREHDGRGPDAVERDAERELEALLERERRAPLEDPRRARRVDARELRRLPRGGPDGGRSRSSTACASATANVYVEDKGDVFNSDLTQAIELGYLLDLAAAHAAGRHRAQGVRGAHSRPHDYPTRDDENFLKHSITRWVDGEPPSSRTRRSA